MPMPGEPRCLVSSLTSSFFSRSCSTFDPADSDRKLAESLSLRCRFNLSPPPTYITINNDGNRGFFVGDDDDIGITLLSLIQDMHTAVTTHECCPWGSVSIVVLERVKLPRPMRPSDVGHLQY